MRQRKKDEFIFGMHPVLEAIDSGKEMEKVLLQQDLKGPQIPKLREQMKLHGIPYQYVPKEKLNRITMKNHQGIIAFPSPITYQNLEQLLPVLYEEGEEPFILVLDRITDVGNFGAIARSAECAGVHAIVVPSRGSAMISAHAVKASAGALYKIPVCREDNLKDSIDFLHNSGLKVIASTEKAEDYCDQANLSGPCALIMGSEEDGISPEYLKRSDVLVKIPMFGEIGSLNVSVATGIILYEVQRQRRNG